MVVWRSSSSAAVSPAGPAPIMIAFCAIVLQFSLCVDALKDYSRQQAVEIDTGDRMPGGNRGSFAILKAAHYCRRRRFIDASDRAYRGLLRRAGPCPPC